MSKEILIIYLLLVSVSFGVPAYGEEEFDIGSMLGDGLDMVGNLGQSTVNGTDLPDDTKQRIDKAIEGGIPVAKKHVDAWTSSHHYVVETIFNNSPISIPHGVVWLVSLGLIGFGIFHFLKKTFKALVIIALPVIAIFMAIIVLGIEIQI